MIVIVDDEERYVRPYIDELKETGYEVNVQTDVGAAEQFLMENLADVELLVLDVMMPPGDTMSQRETHHGLRTGMYFYRTIRTLALDLPIIVFTNVVDTEVFDFFNAEASTNCWFYRKQDLLPFELAEIVQRILFGRSHNA